VTDAPAAVRGRNNLPRGLCRGNQQPGGRCALRGRCFQTHPAIVDLVDLAGDEAGQNMRDADAVRRAISTVWAPSRANPWASAAPIPDDAPVISTTCPWNLPAREFAMEEPFSQSRRAPGVGARSTIDNY
jgi:hypothetical protein